jgi:hypothetical protein
MSEAYIYVRKCSAEERLCWRLGPVAPSAQRAFAPRVDCCSVDCRPNSAVGRHYSRTGLFRGRSRFCQAETSDSRHACRPGLTWTGLGSHPARAPRQAVVRLMPPNNGCTSRHFRYLSGSSDMSVSDIGNRDADSAPNRGGPKGRNFTLRRPHQAQQAAAIRLLLTLS